MAIPRAAHIVKDEVEGRGVRHRPEMEVCRVETMFHQKLRGQAEPMLTFVDGINDHTVVDRFFVETENEGRPSGA